MKVLADKMNLDIFDIIELANTKPYGFRRFFPGPGIGGHCIPIDPNYILEIIKSRFACKVYKTFCKHKYSCLKFYN